MRNRNDTGGMQASRGEGMSVSSSRGKERERHTAQTVLPSVPSILLLHSVCASPCLESNRPNRKSFVHTVSIPSLLIAELFGRSRSSRCALSSRVSTVRRAQWLATFGVVSEQAAGASVCPASRSISAARLEWRGRGRVRGSGTAGSASAKLMPMRDETKYVSPVASTSQTREQSIAFDPRKREKTRCVEERGSGTSKLQWKDENIPSSFSHAAIQRYTGCVLPVPRCVVLVEWQTVVRCACCASGTGGSDSVCAGSRRSIIYCGCY
ncbi:hypothetical protein B0H13DRAFT_1898271 [Mycena leptocephala]|nr:hypothetical protein B0H13DRAFT_1898271 [Mycena leptocephala]